MNRRSFLVSSFVTMSANPLLQAESGNSDDTSSQTLLFLPSETLAARFFNVEIRRSIIQPKGLLNALTQKETVKDGPIRICWCKEVAEPVNGNVHASKCSLVALGDNVIEDTRQMMAMKMDFALGAEEKPIKDHESVSQVWIAKQKNSKTQQARCFVRSEQPISFAAIIVTKKAGLVNVYFAESIQVVDRSRSLIRMSGTVISGSYDDVWLIDSADIELNQRCIKYDLDEAGSMTAIRQVDSSEMLELLGALKR